MACPACGSSRVSSRRESDGDRYIYESACDACGHYWTDDGGETLGSLLSAARSSPSDRRGDDLLAAIHADPDADDPRWVYADHLQERGDPRGEFIALQLARHRSGGDATPRERELLARHARAWLAPLSTLLEMYRFERGFVVAGQLPERASVDGVIGHPIWSTIEDLVCDHVGLVGHPCMRALRRFGAWTPDVIAALADGDVDLRVEQLVGAWYLRSPSVVRLGVPIGDFEVPWQRIFEVGRLTRVRSLSLATPRTPDYPIVRRLLHSRLGNQLVHVEIVDEREYMLETWVAVVRDHPSLRSVSFRGRGITSAPDHSEGRVVIERDAAGALALRLEIVAVAAAGVDSYTMRTLARMSHGTIRRLTITCPARDIERARFWLEPYADDLGPGFDDIAIVTT